MAQVKRHGRQLHGGGRKGKMNDVNKLATEALQTLIRNAVAPFSTTITADHGAIGVAKGSGTLVQMCNRTGILTCAHAADTLRTGQEFGLGLQTPNSSYWHLPKIPVSQVRKFVIGSGNESRSGPDIAFIELPEEIASSIKARASVLNLDHERYSAAGYQVQNQMGYNVIVGSVEKLNSRVKLNEQSDELHNHTIIIAGTASNYSSTNGTYDVIEFVTDLTNSPKNVSSFGGVSGGGLWTVYVEDDGYQLKYRDKRLHGVAFLEEIGPPRKIICNGPSAVFSELRKKIALG
jgi:hypothetical protein